MNRKGFKPSKAGNTKPKVSLEMFPAIQQSVNLEVIELYSN